MHCLGLHWALSRVCGVICSLKSKFTRFRWVWIYRQLIWKMQLKPLTDLRWWLLYFIFLTATLSIGSFSIHILL
jgi:hypothetical protein